MDLNLIVENIPKFYHCFPENDKKGVMIVTELLGDNLENLLKKFTRFSVATTMKIGLHVVCIKFCCIIQIDRNY